uniref:EGF-like domain-containing protein n=1 Tax=Glossina pallidipes TaxID=7398 RepID=A0A1A9Z8N6_GLOPL
MISKAATDLSLKLLNWTSGRSTKSELRLRDNSGQYVVGDLAKSKRFKQYFINSVQELPSQLDNDTEKNWNTLRSVDGHRKYFRPAQTNAAAIGDLILSLDSCKDKISPRLIFKCSRKLRNYDLKSPQVVQSKALQIIFQVPMAFSTISLYKDVAQTIPPFLSKTELSLYEDFDECNNNKFHDCSSNADCFNLKGTYTCSCREGFIDLSKNNIHPGRLCSAEIIGCAQCQYQGKCTLSGLKSNSYICECFLWYTGANCGVNLKIFLIGFIAAGSFLFSLLLFSVLLTYIRRKKVCGLDSSILTCITIPDNPDFNRDKEIQSTFPHCTSQYYNSSSNCVRNVSGAMPTAKSKKKSIMLEKCAIIKDSSSDSSENSVISALRTKEHVILFTEEKNIKRIIKYPISVPMFRHTIASEYQEKSRAGCRTFHIWDNFKPHSHKLSWIPCGIETSHQAQTKEENSQLFKSFFFLNISILINNPSPANAFGDRGTVWLVYCTLLQFASTCSLLSAMSAPVSAKNVVLGIFVTVLLIAKYNGFKESPKPFLKIVRPYAHILHVYNCLRSTTYTFARLLEAA